MILIRTRILSPAIEIMTNWALINLNQIIKILVIKFNISGEFFLRLHYFM